MVAHYHGQKWNAAELARSLGTSEPTTRKYLDLLTGMYLVRQLPPWFENVGKRQVKAPKVYIRDSGLLHSLLKLDQLFVVYPGGQSLRLADKVELVSIQHLPKRLELQRGKARRSVRAVPTIPKRRAGD